MVLVGGSSGQQRVPAVLTVVVVVIDRDLCFL